jgi:hypothetical protein
MSLLVNEKSNLEVTVRYSIEKGILTFHEEQSDNTIVEEKFFFKRPNWKDHRSMMSSLVMQVTNDELSPTVNLYGMMDVRIKTLLKDWTLKDDDGNNLAVTPENIDRLDHRVIEYVFNKLSAELSPATDEHETTTSKSV